MTNSEQNKRHGYAAESTEGISSNVPTPLVIRSRTANNVKVFFQIFFRFFLLFSDIFPKCPQKQYKKSLIMC